VLPAEARTKQLAALNVVWLAATIQLGDLQGLPFLAIPVQYMKSEQQLTAPSSTAVQSVLQFAQCLSSRLTRF
jgi:hypothetical protein